MPLKAEYVPPTNPLILAKDKVLAAILLPGKEPLSLEQV